MRILLDIDETLVDKNGNVHPRADELFQKYEVVLFSAEDDIADWAKRYNVDYVSKHDETIPEGFILIDDDEYFANKKLNLVKYKYYFRCINEFFEVMEI